MQLRARDGIVLTLALGLMLAAAGAALAATTDLPYTPDETFGTQGVVIDPLANLAPSSPPRAAGDRLTQDGDGNTIVAGMATVWFFDDLNYLVVTRYGLDGQRQTWSNPTADYSDDAHEYLLIRPLTAPENLHITAVQDVKIGAYGDINVLVDALEPSPSSNTDSLVVTFGPDGEYKGIVTHMATPNVDDAGAAILPWGSEMFVASSAGSTITLARYTLNLSDGVSAINAAWASSGKANQSLWKCSNFVGGVTIAIPCQLRARRALIAEDNGTTSIYVAGEYADQQVGGVAESELFLTHFKASDGTSGAAYPFTWGFAGTKDELRGMEFRSKIRSPQRPQSELYLLNAFPRQCRSGFIVLRVNADTGTYMDRTWTQGGGTDPDPGVCATVTSLEAADLALPQSYGGASRNLSVVGSRFTGEIYTGKNAFAATVDTQDMHAAVPVQEFTRNAGQYPDDAGFKALTYNHAAGTITATGIVVNYEGDSSSALTIRMRQDPSVFRDGFEQP